jgi:hypothetical protein
MDSKATVIPRWSFRPMGLASEYYSFDSRFMRYSALPKEIVCTENLIPWEKLLACESQVIIIMMLLIPVVTVKYIQNLYLKTTPIKVHTHVHKLKVITK